MDGISVWEWCKEGFWIPYSTLVCKQLEDALSKRQSSVHLGDVEPFLNGLTIHLQSKNFVQKNSLSNSETKVRRRLYPANSAPGYGVSWLWDNNVNFEAYDTDVQCVLEELYALGLQDVNLGVTYIHLPYHIDLVNMIQTNVTTGFTRTVLRSQVVKYPQVRLQPHEYLEVIKSPRELVTLQEIYKSKPRINRPEVTIAKAEADKFFEPKASHAAFTTDVKESTSATNKPSQASAELDKEAYNNDTSSFGVLLRLHGTFVRPTSSDESCCICCSEFDDPSPYGSCSRSAVELTCKHTVHVECLRQSADVAAITCPVCKKMYGTVEGTQPKNGVMQHTVVNIRLPGHEKYNTIQITYQFGPGTQGPEHPHPGRRYSAHGFPRTAFLPNNPEGQKVLSLLKTAFDRRLVFTVGQSSTSGATDTVTWNDIHHKTSVHGGSVGYGYPDETYLQRVTKELEAHGVM